MAIDSRPFGGVVLTGEDAERFRRHMVEAAPPQAAEAIQRGVAMAEEIAVTGRATVHLNVRNGAQASQGRDRDR